MTACAHCLSVTVRARCLSVTACAHCLSVMVRAHCLSVSARAHCLSVTARAHCLSVTVRAHCVRLSQGLPEEAAAAQCIEGDAEELLRLPQTEELAVVEALHQGKGDGTLALPCSRHNILQLSHYKQLAFFPKALRCVTLSPLSQAFCKNRIV